MPINLQNITWDDDNSRPSQIVWDDEGVGKEIIDRMKKAESNNNPNAISKKGAMGTMQLMPATAKELGVTDPFDEEQNIQAGTKYVNAMYRKYGDTEKALAAYNWGPGNLDKHLKKNPDSWKEGLPAETRNYIAKVNTPKPDNIKWDDDSIVWDDKPSIIDQAVATVKGVGKNIVGKGEAALSTVSGLMATPVAGLAGLVTSAGGLYPEKGAQTVEDISNLLTYRPQTERGVQEAELINKPLELLDTGTGWLGQKVADITGYPELGAATKAGAMIGLPALGGRLAKAIPKGKAPVEAPVKSIVESPELRPVEVLDESKAVLPPVQEGYVRLYRGQKGERPPLKPLEEMSMSDNWERGRWYTTDLERAKDYADTSSGKVRYVDVPEAVSKEAWDAIGDENAIAGHRLLDPEWANKSIPIEKYEAYVKGGSTSPLPKYAEGSAINLDRLDTTMDVKQLVNQFAKENEAKIGKKTVTWEETQQAARDLAWDEKDFLKTARTKGSFNAAEIDAMRTIHTNAISDLQRTLREIPADRAKLTDATRLEILDKVNNYIEILKATSTKSSEAGRALNIHKRMMAEDPDFIANTNMQKAMKQIMEKRGGKKLTDDLINDLKDVDWKDPASVKDILKKYNKASPGDMVYEAWLNGILSNPSTHATNIVSNALTLTMKPPEHVVASILRREMPFGEMKAETVGMIQGLREGVRAGLKAFKTGEASEMWNKVETARTPSIPGKTGEVVRIPTKALTGADEFFKAIVYRSEFNRLAFLEAKKTGAKGKALADKMAELLDNPTADMLEKSHQEALYRTFNKPLGRIGNRVMALRNDVPGLKYIVPFIRTPANIAKYALERTPLAAGKIALDLKRGNLTKAELYDDLSRSAIGSAIGVVTYQMAKEGIITGGGPKNAAERETKYRTGWQPYSVKIGNKYYSYNRLEPLGSVLGLSADLADVTKIDDESKASEKFGRIAASFGKNITSKTFLQGVSNLLDATSDPDRYGEKFIKQLASSTVPSVVGGITRAKDPTVYETGTPLEAIKAKAGITGGMYPKRDIWGRPIERAGTTATRMVSPIIPSQVKDDPVDIELDRLNLAISVPSKKVRGVELEPGEYDAYAKRAGELSRERVERYMSSGAYDHLRDELKKLAVRNIVEKSRVQAGMELWKDMERGRRFKPIDKKYGTNLSNQ